MEKNLVQDLIAKISELTLKVQEVEKRLSDLENGSLGTGIYLDGSPDYVSDFITKKEGE